jgi:integrase
MLHLPRRSPHDARRTYATALLNSGASDMFIIDQMGHTDVNTTKQYYYRDVRNVKDKLKLIDELIG